MAKENLYQRLGVLLSTAPTFEERPLSGASKEWLARLRVALKEVGDGATAAAFEVQRDFLGQDSLLAESAREKVMQCLYDALAAVSDNAPVEVRGAFIPAGNAFDALTAVRKILDGASNGVLIVDPYADAKILETYAIQAAEPVEINILAAQGSVKADLKPAVQAWVQQYQTNRHLKVRLAPAHSLHDRLIVVDRKVWVVGQSFNALATRAHTSIVRVDDETAALKRAAYVEIWQNAVPI